MFTSFKATTQIQQRVETERGDVRSAPSVSAFQPIFLVLDPTGSLLPLLLVPFAGQLIELDENLAKNIYLLLKILMVISRD